jgi:glucose-1-phosphate thymidylyltransferase
MTNVRGIILAGGIGSRLDPLTRVTNKHLLPVYDKPMIFYPINTLVNSGITDITIVLGGNSVGDIVNLLGDGADFGGKFSYVYQKTAGGIAQALGLNYNESDLRKLVVILGDNIFEDNFRDEVNEFAHTKDEARIFMKKVENPSRFGVVEFDDDGVVISIEEKPKVPKSDFAVTGIYMYPYDIFDVIRTLVPSNRNELEITDANNYYVKKNRLKSNILTGYWSDAGTFETLFRASSLVK